MNLKGTEAEPCTLSTSIERNVAFQKNTKGRKTRCEKPQRVLLQTEGNVHFRLSEVRRWQNCRRCEPDCQEGVVIGQVARAQANLGVFQCVGKRWTGSSV